MKRLGPVFRHGHWSRRDCLDDLSPAMRAALTEAAAGRLRLVAASYVGRGEHRPATIHALARRRLLRIDAGRDGLGADYLITQLGRDRAAEIARRAAVGAKLWGTRA